MTNLDEFINKEKVGISSLSTSGWTKVVKLSDSSKIRDTFRESLLLLQDRSVYKRS